MWSSSSVYLGGAFGVLVLNGQQVQPIPLVTAIAPLADNQTTDSSPSFSFTATSRYSPIAPIPQSVYFQMDTWQGPWARAIGTAPDFTGQINSLGLGQHIIYAFAGDGQETGGGAGAVGASGDSQLITGAIAAYPFTVIAGLGMGVASGSSSSVTVTAGSTASYTLGIGGRGIAGTATLTCTGAPTAATCTVPATEDISATTATTFAVSVKTTAKTSASLLPHSSLGWFWATALIGLVVLPSAASRKSMTMRWLRGLPILLILFIIGCGGGNSGGGGGGGGGSSGTPAGTYTLTVTATMGSTMQSTMLTLIVK